MEKETRPSFAPEDLPIDPDSYFEMESDQEEELTNAEELWELERDEHDWELV